MTSRPILFTGPMVQAFLDGRKTQTRRLVKPQPQNGQPSKVSCAHWETSEGQFKCPYGAPGDQLWVKETWRNQDGITILYRNKDEIEYRADGDRPKELTDCYWKPSIHMPRWASRITLEIISVGVERVQDITDDDVWAEGAGQLPGMSAQETYAVLWESIYGKDSWKLNPWAWKITFKKL